MPHLLHHSPGAFGARRVFLATPTYGAPPALYTFCLFKTHDALKAAGIEVELGLLCGDCHVDDARNRLVRDFLKSGCDDFVFIDADVGWQTDDLVRLLSHDRDVVGGTYPMKQDQEDFPVRLIPGEIWSDSNGLIEVEGLPTGFLRIRRNVLEKLFAESPKYRIRGSDDSEPCALIFERELQGLTRRSGDYAFCRKWRAAGGRIWLDPNCHLEHAGEKVWSGTYAAHLRRKNGLALVDGINRVRKGTEDARSLLDLVLDWGNDPWSAGPELLSACAQVARQLPGAILETGSGLTTLVLAAANPAVTVHALEDASAWRYRIQEAAETLGLTNIVIHKAPLVLHPQGRWYDVPDLPWREFRTVLCDGPPRQKGERSVVLSVLDAHECRPQCLLFDDAETEAAAFASWAADRGYRFEIKGQLRKFALGVRNVS
jgi:hypothetical protein